MFDLSEGLVLAPMWLWLIVAVALGIIEAFTVGLSAIWFAIGAVAASVVSIFADSFLIQLFVFIIISLLLLYFTRPLAVKKLNKDTIKTNIDAVIGGTGMAESDIRRYENGTVKADNKLWTAVLAEGSPDIMKGDRITVLSVEGVKLIVKKEE